MNKRTQIALTAAIVAALVLPATAQAHVTVLPSEVPAGEFVRLDVRVPNELDDASTEKVELQLPAGFASASYEPVAGWDVRVRRTKLAKPIVEEGEKITERVSRITWTGQGEQGKVAPGQFQDFGLSVRMPAKAGSLTFKAIQTYDNGEVVRWIGPPDSEEPAPQVQLTAAAEEGGAAAEEEGGEAQPAASEEEEDDESDTLSIVALIAGGLGLVMGGSALVTARRRRS
jgi:uncharacterized protein YcnI